MPITQITLLPGYDPAARERLVHRVSLAVRSVIAAPPAGTTTYVQEAATYARDGRVFAGGNPAQPDAAEVVQAFLQAMQARDLAAAAAWLAPGFRMHFPGNARFERLDELLAWAAGRYRRVGKSIERIEQVWGDGVTVVFCHGTLHGEWLDGSPFEGIRFIDRFEVVEGRLTRQDVWNDLAEHQPRGTAPG